ncbi:EamA family transporter [Candidatus Saccharibacteria bacterium]|nr:EamA family transporter [Candidatus Saccharibacteria bacterium]
MMTWQFFVLISILASAAAALLQKVLMRKEHINPIAFAAGLQIIAGLLVGIVVLFNGWHIPDIGPIWLNLLIMPFLYGFANITKFKSLKKIDASEFTVIYQASTLFKVFVAVTFLDEVFKSYQVFGLALIISAVILVTLKNRITFKLSEGELWGLACAALYGFAFANDVFILRTFDLWTYTFLAFMVPGLMTLVYLGKSAKTVVHLFDRGSVWIFLLSSIACGAVATSMYAAYQTGRNAAQIASIIPTYSILIVVLAAIFLNERDHLPRKLVAAVLAVIGISLLK